MAAIAGIIIVGFVLFGVVRLVPALAVWLCAMVKAPVFLWENTRDTFRDGTEQSRYRTLTIVSFAVFGVMLITTIIIAIALP